MQTEDNRTALLKLISRFVEEERKRFENGSNNIFAFSFGQVTRYYQFSLISFSRYSDSNSKFLKIMDAEKKAFKGINGPISPELQTLLNESAEAGLYLHYDIESFYQFAKILLDKIAHAIELYFGQAREKSLDSHDDLTKNLNDFCKIKKLKLESKLVSIAKNLRKDISDYRDYKISHLKSPRVVKGTTWAGNKTRMHISKIYPTEKDIDEQKEDLDTKFLEDLLLGIENYMREAIEFMKLNRDKTNLKLEIK